MSSDLGPLGRLNIFVDRGEAAMDTDLDGDLGPGRADMDLGLNLASSTRGLRFDAPIDSRGPARRDDDLPVGMGSDLSLDIGPGGPMGVTDDRTDNFELSTGQFRDPDTGAFEPGGPPPDYDPGPDRFRAKTGRFKSSPADHFDEPAEARLDSLEPKG